LGLRTCRASGAAQLANKPLLVIIVAEKRIEAAGLVKLFYRPRPYDQAIFDGNDFAWHAIARGINPNADLGLFASIGRLIHQPNCPRGVVGRISRKNLALLQLVNFLTCGIEHFPDLRSGEHALPFQRVQNHPERDGDPITAAIINHLSIPFLQPYAGAAAIFRDENHASGFEREAAPEARA
jgi:hypothetical protein